MTKKRKLSPAMEHALGVLAGLNVMITLTIDKTYMPYSSDARSYNALADRGLAEEVYPPKVNYGGFRITKAGWDYLGMVPLWDNDAPLAEPSIPLFTPAPRQKPAPPAEPNTHEVTGYSYTRVDCPDCDFINYVEGDAKGDTVECEECKTKLVVRSII